MSATTITTETTITTMKHLLNGRDDAFTATATGLTITQVQDIKVSHGYPDLDKMRWSLEMLEQSLDAPTTTATRPAIPNPAPGKASPSTAAPASALRPTAKPGTSGPARPREASTPKPRRSDPRPARTTARQVKPSANELIVAASRSPKARNRALGTKIAALLGDLSDRLAAEEAEQVAKAAEDAANAQRRQRIEELEAELRDLRTKTRTTKTAPTLGAPAATVREWAKEQGIECPAFGKVPARVRDAYDADHVAA